MKNLMTNISLFVICLTALSTVGTAMYKWLKFGDKVACTANEYSFGCSTVLGYLLSAVGVIIDVGAVYLWERNRGQ